MNLLLQVLQTTEAVGTQQNGDVIISMLNSTKHIISDWRQLSNVEDIKINDNYYSLKVCAYNLKDFVGTTVEIIRYKYQHKEEYTILYSFIVDAQKLMNNTIIIADKQLVMSIINSFGFKVEWKNQITLSIKEYDILCSLFKLGYNYIEKITNGQKNNNNKNYIAVTKNMLNTYDSNFVPKLLTDVCNVDITVNDFKWLKSYDTFSIPQILGISVI